LNEALEAAGNPFLGSSTLTLLTTSAYEIGLEQKPVLNFCVSLCDKKDYIYEIHTTNHVDHSYSYSSPTENPDVNEPEKIQSTPYFKADIKSPFQIKLRE
jgi:hypothetical protein